MTKLQARIKSQASSCNIPQETTRQKRCHFYDNLQQIEQLNVINLSSNQYVVCLFDTDSFEVCSEVVSDSLC